MSCGPAWACNGRRSLRRRKRPCATANMRARHGSLAAVVGPHPLLDPRPPWILALACATSIPGPCRSGVVAKLQTTKGPGNILLPLIRSSKKHPKGPGSLFWTNISDGSKKSQSKSRKGPGTICQTCFSKIQARSEKVTRKSWDPCWPPRTLFRPFSSTFWSHRKKDLEHGPGTL